MGLINTSLRAGQVFGINRLKAIQSTMNQSLERLQTGYRINSAKDDPARLVDAVELSRRIGGHENAITNNQETVYQLSEVDTAQQQLIDSLLSIRSKISGVEGETDTTVKNSLVEEVASLIQYVESITQTTKFRDESVLNGSGRMTFKNFTANTLDTVKTHISYAQDGANLNIVFDNANIAKRATVSGAYALPAANASEFTVKSDSGSRTVTLAAGVNLTDALEQMNDELSTIDVSVYAQAGNLVFATDEFGDERSLTYTHNNGDTLIAAPATGAGKDGMVSVNGTDFTLEGDLRFGYGDLDLRGILVFDPDKVSPDLFSGAAPASTTAIVSPEGGIRVHTGAETGYHDSVRLGFRDLTATALDLSDLINPGSTSYMLDNPNQALEVIDEALTAAKNSNSELGSAIKYNLESQNSLMTGLLEAMKQQESALIDSDQAHELAIVAKMQFLQETASSALAAQVASERGLLQLLDMNR